MMIDRSLRALLLAGFVAAAPTAALAQGQTPLSPEEEISPRQVQQPPKPQRAPRTRALPAAAAQAEPRAVPAAAPKPGPAPRSVACSGAFARDSSHVKLAQTFSGNVDFGEIAGPDNTTLMASIVFPKDPKRRLEVLWQNEATRTDISLIAINGQSQWSAPKGLRLGLALAALEKINGKPFTLSGFDQPNGGSALDWQGGVLASLPGGCKVGIRLAPDAKAPPEAVSAAAGAEFQSNDAAMRAARPVVSEIILGY